MNYGVCRRLLSDMGIWSPLRPGPRNPRLHWGDRQGHPFRGTYLNETAADLAYFTLNSRCVLKQDEELWLDLPLGLVAESEKAHRNIYPRLGKERDALHQLLSGSRGS